MAKYSESLQKAINNINKIHGQGSVIDLQNGVISNVEILCSTGSVKLNKAIGIKGYPKGRIIEIKGPESSGKTTLALHAIAEAQKVGVDAGFVDAEHALDLFYAKNLGVNVDRLVFSQPDSGEQALDIAYNLIIGGIGLVIVDSVAALVPQAELDGDFGDSKVGLQARLMSQAMRKLRGVVNQTKCTLIFINQIRQKIGVTWGTNETEPGGNALKFYASIRLDIRRIGTNKETVDGIEESISNRVKVKVIKNKMAPPFKIAEFDILFGTGISKESELIDMAIEEEVLKETGAGVLLNYESPFFPATLAIESTAAKAAIILNKDERFALIKKEIEWSLRLVQEEVTQEEYDSEFKEAWEKAKLALSKAEGYWEEHSYYSGRSQPDEAIYFINKAIECNPWEKKYTTKLKQLEKKVDENLVKGISKTVLEFKDGTKIDIETGEVIETPPISIEETKEVIDKENVK